MASTMAQFSVKALQALYERFNTEQLALNMRVRSLISVLLIRKLVFANCEMKYPLCVSWIILILLESSKLCTCLHLTWIDLQALLRLVPCRAYVDREVYEETNTIYLLQELCLGGELYDRLDQQDDLHYTEAICARLVKQIVSAVRYLHSKGVVHRGKDGNFSNMTKR